jgi:hypothetical protein
VLLTLVASEPGTMLEIVRRQPPACSNPPAGLNRRAGSAPARHAGDLDRQPRYVERALSRPPMCSVVTIRLAATFIQFAHIGNSVSTVSRGTIRPVVSRHSDSDGGSLPRERLGAGRHCCPGR